MQQINSESELKAAILLLESKQSEEIMMLREQFHLTTESIKPLNILKSTLSKVTGSEETRENIVSTSVGVTAGHFSKVLFERVSDNPFRKIIGTALLFGVTNVFAKHPGIVKSVGQVIFGFIRRKLGARNAKISRRANIIEI